MQVADLLIVLILCSSSCVGIDRSSDETLVLERALLSHPPRNQQVEVKLYKFITM